MPEKRFAEESLRDRELARPLVREIERLAAALDRPLQIMEVCGTHTVALRRHGIHSLLPRSIRLVSGPGCPVCVTPTGVIDAALGLLEREDVRVATFGDMLRVPGSAGVALQRHLGGGRVRLVYSPAELLPLAAADPRPLIFLGIGFETTSPTVASVFLKAAAAGVGNLFLYPAFKTVPRALQALLAGPGHGIHGFLLPGHVSVIIGTVAYRFLEGPGGVPGVVAGFEPLDLLSGILGILRQATAGQCRVENAYTRAVRAEGNPRAREILDRFLEPADALWRGLGVLPGSGLEPRPEFAALDARRRFDLPEVENVEPAGCRCGQVIQGLRIPPECALFGGQCTPEQPVGPCMVSSEGTCAAWYRYGGETA